MGWSKYNEDNNEINEIRLARFEKEEIKKREMIRCPYCFSYFNTKDELYIHIKENYNEPKYYLIINGIVVNYDLPITNIASASITSRDEKNIFFINGNEIIINEEKDITYILQEEMKNCNSITIKINNDEFNVYKINYGNIDINKVNSIIDEWNIETSLNKLSIGEHIILRLSGSINDSGYRTCQLEFKGEGCRDYERRNQTKTWIDFFIFIALLNGTFKRIDIAIDDFIGDTVDMDYILEKVKNRYYTSVFKSKPNQMGNEEKGLSVTFGSRNSEQELCIYDKRKEQINRRKLVDLDYWMRYELRFRGEKAQSIVAQLISKYNKNHKSDFQTTAFEQLYRMLDIKEDNNYDEKYQSKVETDERWNEFLKNVQKGTLVTNSQSISTLEKHSKFIEDKAVFYLILMYLSSNKNIELFLTNIFRLMYKHSEFSKKRFRRLNLYLVELKTQPLTDEDLADLRIQLFSIIKERELPF